MKTLPKAFVWSLLLLLLPQQAQSASSGIVEVCDTNATWGCTTWDVDEAGYVDRLKCIDTSPGLMPWTAAPEDTNMYTLRAGDGVVSDDAAHYFPGDITSIYLRTHSTDFKWRGLLVYAEDDNGTPVGEWVLPSESNAKFHTPPCAGHADGTTLLHVSAEIKPFVVRLLWRAPKATTGTVRFKALVKRGPANHGWFYTPNNGKPLTLTESPAVAQHWYLGTKAKSCEDVCKAEQKSCNEDSASKVGSAAAFEAEVGRSVACPLPLVAGCADHIPGKDARGMCFYRDSDCLSDFSCAAVPTDARFCPCGAYVAPPETTGGNIASSAGRASDRGFLLVVLVSSVSLLLSPRSHSTSLLVVALCLCLVIPASAHNWLHTPGRAFRQASTIRPCLGRKASDLHAQVGPGQEMVFKWATGHSRDSWIVTVAGADADKLADPDLIQKLQDYIDNAPANSNEALSNPRVHGAKQAKHDDAPAYYADKSWYSQKLDTSHADWLDHPEAPTEVLLRYNQAKLAKDYRIAYENPDYPWLLSVFKFPHLYHLPHDYDAIKMSLPSYAKPGHHIVHWRWNGYYDCVDVDYRASTVPAIYGESTGSFVYNRQDHCQYVEPTSVTTNCRDGTYGVERCFKEQSTSGNRRLGINVVPLTNPRTVAAMARDEVNIPWNDPVCVNNPWTQFTGGVLSESDVAWNTWELRSTIAAGGTCTGGNMIKEQASTLKQAIMDCSASACAGISWETTAGGGLPQSGTYTFRLCSSLASPAADALWTTATKKDLSVDPVVGQTLTYHFARDSVLDTLDTSGLNGLDVTQFVAAQNVYGEDNKNYGWKCAHRKEGGNLNNDKTLLKNQFLHVSSGCGDNGIKACVDNFCFQGDSVDDVADPNVWETEVPDGYYETTLHFARFPSATNVHALADCFVEGHRVSANNPPANAANAGRFSATNVVQVLDGRLTLGGVSRTNGKAFFACTAVEKLEIKPIGPSYTPAWMPGRIGAWAQLKLETSSNVGLVTIKNRAFSDCGSWWLFHGNHCFEADSDGENRPLGQFHSAKDGAVVGVSDTPCSGSSCSGTECGRIDFPTRSNSPDFSIDCKGAKGQYVYVFLPGSKRIMGIKSISVNKPAPEAAEGTYVCYGVEARPQTETEPEYIVTDDPEDPVFYSTCYVREKNTTWLPVEKEPETRTWRFNGQCLDCDSYEANVAVQTRYGSMGTPKWKLAETCYDCDTSATTIKPPAEPKWLVKAQGARCDFTSRNSCTDQKTNRCQQELFMQDGTPPLTPEQCEAASIAAQGCSDTYEWFVSANGGTTRCSCYLAEACCAVCTPLSSALYTLYTTPKAADPTCSTGIKDANNELCCEASCLDTKNASVCATTNCRSTDQNVRGACCSDYAVPLCSEQGPPCKL